MTDEQALLITLAKIGTNLTRVSLNAVPATQKRGFIQDLQEIINRANVQLAAVRTAVREEAA